MSTVADVPSPAVTSSEDMFIFARETPLRPKLCPSSVFAFNEILTISAPDSGNRTPTKAPTLLNVRSADFPHATDTFAPDINP